MNPPKPPTFFSSLRKVLFFIGGIYFGFWLMVNGDQDFYWIGYVFVMLGGIMTIFSLFDLTRSSVKAALELDKETETLTPSGIFGSSRLARIGDPIIEKMSNKCGFLVGALRGTLLFFDPFANGMGHMISIGMTRAGKSICLVITALLYWQSGSIFITDTKGEVSKITRKIRKKMRHNVVEWNPFSIHGDKGISINPLQFLLDDVRKNEGKNLKEFAATIAYGLIPIDPEDKQPFFARGGRRLLIGLMFYLAVIEKSKCHLPGLREMVWSSMEKKKEIFTVMTACPFYGGILKEYGQNLIKQLAPEYFRTFGPMLENAMDVTDIYESHTDFGKSLMKNDYDLEDFLKKKTTFYAIFSEATSDRYGVAALIIAIVLFKKIGMRPKGFPILFLIEEAGNIGVFPKLEEALSLLAAKNVRVWLIFQDYMQIVLRYGLYRAKLILSQTRFKQYLSINDFEQAEYLSKRSGQETVKTYQYSQDTSSSLSNWRVSVSETGKSVLRPDQLLETKEDTQFIDINKNRLIEADLVPYFQVKEFRENADPNPYHPEGYPADKPIKFSLHEQGSAQ